MVLATIREAISRGKLYDGKYDEENQPPCPMILVVHDEGLLNFQKNNKYFNDKQLIDYHEKIW